MEGPTRRASMRKADMKIVLLGDMDVGKTSLILRYIERKFQDTVSTIGASFLLKQWGHYNIAIWDTAGEEKYHGLNAFYCRNTSAAILVFDLNNAISFESLRLRYLPLLDSVDPSILKVIVGSKLDLVGSASRQVTAETARSFATEINSKSVSSKQLYFETSSRTGQGVDSVFEAIFDVFFPSKGCQRRPDLVVNHAGTVGLTLQGNTVKQKTCCRS